MTGSGRPHTRTGVLSVILSHWPLSMLLFAKNFIRRQKETGAALEAYLHSLVDPYGEVTASQVTSRLRGDVLTVTLTAECREELGTQAPIYTANEPDGASG